MWCPKCGKRSSVVGTKTADIVERFRACPYCGYSWQTVEVIRFDDYWRNYAKETCENNPKLQKIDSDKA